MKQHNIEDIKAQLPNGMWFLTGGVMRMQKAVKARYTGEELERELKSLQLVMKLQLLGEQLLVTTISRDAGFLTKVTILTPEQAKFYTKDDEIIIAFEKSHNTIHGETKEEIKSAMIKVGTLTDEEFEKYSDPVNWNSLPRIEFTIVDKIEN